MRASLGALQMITPPFIQLSAASREKSGREGDMRKEREGEKEREREGGVGEKEMGDRRKEIEAGME